jgi:putative ABC transport system permease protein
MGRFLQNFRFGTRLLRKNPGFSAVAVITLALGIGATTSIYSVVYATLLEPLPYPQPNQLVMVWSKASHGRNSVSAGDFLDWKRGNSVFQDIDAASGQSFNLANGGRPEQIDAQVATPDYYKMMGMRFLLGRNFLPEEGETGREHVVVLTNKFWKHLGAKPEIIGRQLRLSGELYTVVGVTAAGPLDRIQFQVIVPLAFKPEQINHDDHWLYVMGRLKPGVTVAEAQADMDVVARRIAEEHPQSNKGWGVSVEPLKDDFLPDSTKSTLWLLMGAVGFVLLIACANVANLLLTKGTTRMKEVAVRTSLGASRWQVFNQFLTESLILAVLGGVAGIGTGVAMTRVLMAKMPVFTLPSEADVRLNIPVLLFALAATTVSGILFGCAPAWNASRVDPNESLKEGGRSGTGAGRKRLRQALVVVEFALALTLLAGAGLAIHSFWNLAHVNLGVRTDHILTFGVSVPQDRSKEPAQIVAFDRQILEKIGSLPGVTESAASTGLPLRGTWFGMQFSLSGKPVGELAARPSVGFRLVTPKYFDTFGIQTVAGRGFTEQDRTGSVRVAIVNETFAKRYLADLDPLKQRVLILELVPGLGLKKDSAPLEWQIVGVARDYRNGNVRRETFPEIDVPLWQSPWPEVGIAVRTAGDPGEMAKSIAAAVSSVEPDLPMSTVRTMDQIVDESLLSDQFNATLYSSFAGVALLLAAVGIYGVMAFTVAQRTHEIGLRMALGAAREQVLGLILKEGMILALLGLGLGLVGACLVGRTMQSMLYGVGTIDLAAFGAVAAALLTAALLACYVPARRAAKVDPMVALRHE